MVDGIAYGKNKTSVSNVDLWNFSSSYGVPHSCPSIFVDMPKGVVVVEVVAILLAFLAIAIEQLVFRFVLDNPCKGLVFEGMKMNVLVDRFTQTVVGQVGQIW